MRSTREIAYIFNHEMKHFWCLTKKFFFSFYFFRKRENLTLPSHFSIILLGSSRLVGIILGVNTVCIYKVLYNVNLMNELEEIFSLRKPLKAAVGVTSKCDFSYFI